MAANEETTIGTVEDIRFTLNSLGNQFTKIDGRVYHTWFDLLDPALKGLKAGCRVEYNAQLNAVIWDSPKIIGDRADIVRVVSPAATEH